MVILNAAWTCHVCSLPFNLSEEHVKVCAITVYPLDASFMWVQFLESLQYTFSQHNLRSMLVFPICYSPLLMMHYAEYRYQQSH